METPQVQTEEMVKGVEELEFKWTRVENVRFTFSLPEDTGETWPDHSSVNPGKDHGSVLSYKVSCIRYR